MLLEWLGESIIIATDDGWLPLLPLTLYFFSIISCKHIISARYSVNSGSAGTSAVVIVHSLNLVLLLIAIGIFGVVGYNPLPLTILASSFFFLAFVGIACGLRRCVAILLISLAYGVGLFFIVTQAESLRFDHAIWQYLSQSMDLLRNGGIPEHSLEYLSLMPYEVNKLALNLHLAMVLSFGADPIEVFHAAIGLPFHFLTILGLSIWWGLSAFNRSAWLCFALMMLLLSSPFVISKSIILSGESMALPLVFALLSILANRQFEGWQKLILVALTLFCVMLTHLVAALVCLQILAFHVFLLLKRAEKEHLRPILTGGAAAMIGVCLVWVLVGASPSSVQELEQNAPTKMGQDQTLLFRHLAAGKDVGSFASVDQMPDTMTKTIITFGNEYRRVLSWYTDRSYMGLAILLGLILLGFAVRSSNPGMLALIPWSFLGLTAVAAYFFFFSDSYIYRTHGLRRELPYLYFMIISAASLHLVGAQSGRGPWTRSSQRLLPLALCTLCGISIFTGSQHLQRRLSSLDELPRTALSFFDYLNTLQNVRLIQDGWGGGAVAALSGAKVLTEGRSPYFQTNNLRSANAALVESRRILSGEAKEAERYLLRNQISHILIGSKVIGAKQFRNFKADLSQLNARPVIQVGELSLYQLPQSGTHAAGSREPSRLN